MIQRNEIYTSIHFLNVRVTKLLGRVSDIFFSEEDSFDLVHCRDDLARAIKKLHVMGSGFQILPVGNKRLVQSVPGELSMDHAAALQLAQVLSFRLTVEIATPSAQFSLLYLARRLARKQ